MVFRHSGIQASIEEQLGKVKLKTKQNDFTTDDKQSYKPINSYSVFCIVLELGSHYAI